MVCSKCKLDLPSDSFYSSGGWCKGCESARKKAFYSKPDNLAKKVAKNKEWQEANRDKTSEYQKTYYLANPEKFKAKQVKRTADIRNEVLNAYGGVCACCGETEAMFLTVDHIFDDGAEERRRLFGTRVGRGTPAMYRWLKKNGFPKDRYRLMCFNCNCGRARNGGTCPHQQKCATVESSPLTKES